jgi:WhiB family redox-sensing transcriptional regulator
MASLEHQSADSGAQIFVREDEGKCGDADPDLFAPGLSDPNRSFKQLKARQICGGCAVQQVCLDYALEHRPIVGVWGKTTERERDWMLKRMNGVAAVTVRSVSDAA